MKIAMQTAFFAVVFLAAASAFDYFTSGQIDLGRNLLTAVIVSAGYMGFTIWQQRRAAGKEPPE